MQTLISIGKHNIGRLTGVDDMGKRKMISNQGYCVICEKNTRFIEYSNWLRDHYVCQLCKSIPRQRAIINTLNTFIPNWHFNKIHESSPSGVTFDYFKKKCTDYTFSQYYKNVKHGEIIEGCRSENLESMTFPDNTFDIFITQDVFEHVLNPEKAFKEISRVLKHNGVHVFTLPWYTNIENTVQRAELDKNGKIKFLKEPIYHGNPIDPSGSLVTFDWGVDMIKSIFEWSKMFTTIYLIKNRDFGLDAEFLHVFISRRLG